MPCHDNVLKAILGALYDALQCREKPRIVFSHFQIGRVSAEGEINMVKVPVDVTMARASIRIVDAFGNPAPVDGAPLWAFSDPTGLELTPDADGMGAAFKSLDGGLRTVQLQVSADADLGAGVVTLTGFADIEFVAGQAAALSVDITLA